MTNFIKFFLLQAFTMTVMSEFGIRMIRKVNSMFHVMKATTLRQLGTWPMKVKVTAVKKW